MSVAPVAPAVSAVPAVPASRPLKRRQEAEAPLPEFRADELGHFLVIFEYVCSGDTYVHRKRTADYHQSLAYFLVAAVPDMDPDMYRDAGYAKLFVNAAISDVYPSAKAQEVGERILMELIMSRGVFGNIRLPKFFPATSPLVDVEDEDEEEEAEEEEEEDDRFLLFYLNAIYEKAGEFTQRELQLIQSAVDIVNEATRFLGRRRDGDEEPSSTFFAATNFYHPLMVLSRRTMDAFVHAENRQRANNHYLETLLILIDLPGVREFAHMTALVTMVCAYFTYLKTTDDFSRSVASRKRDIANQLLVRLGQPPLK